MKAWPWVNRRLPVALVLATHAVLSLGFGLAMPIFEEYDEASHVLYVRYLQIYRALPVQVRSGETARAHHPPGYYLLGALLTAWIPVEGSVDAIHMEPNPNFRPDLEDTDGDNKARWIHYGPAERWPYQGLPLMVHLLRFLSAGFSTLAVWLTYQAAHHLRPADEAFALLAAALLAFNPEVVFLGGQVYNDTAALAGGAAVLYLLGRYDRSGFTPRRWVWLGGVFSLGVLLKVNVLTVAPAIALVWLSEAWRARKAWVWVVNALALIAPVGLLAGWWFARNQVLYGDWTGNAAIVNLWGSPETRGTLWAHAWSLLQDPLGRFGTGEWVRFPDGAYLLADAVIILAVLRAGWSGVAHLRSSRPASGTSPVLSQEIVRPVRRLREVLTSGWLEAQAPPPWRLWAVHWTTLVVTVTAVLAYAMAVIGFTMNRFMFPAYPSLVLILAAGCLAWFRARWHRRVAWVLSGLNLGLAAYALFGLIIPTYAPPRSPMSLELRRMTPLEAEIEGTARILGYRLSAESVKRGETLVVTVYWQPKAPTAIPYTVFVHLYEPGVGSITQRDTYPGLGNYATTVWDTRRPFVDTYRLHVPADVSPVVGAKVLLGLYDSQTLQRLPVTGADAGPPEAAWVEFGNIEVRP